MRAITRSVWSHRSEGTRDRFSVKEVRASQPSRVRNFPDLVEALARVSFHNPDYALFFRGQSHDYQCDEGSTILPSLYRGTLNGRAIRSEIRSSFALLNAAESCLLERFPEVSQHKERHLALRRYSEVCWAILQHYEVTPTPLLDLTTSLRVACSFATESGTTPGVLMVIGMPHPHGSISYYVEELLCNLRLLSICPPEAKRPYYQEGYTAGTFPTRGPEPISSAPDFAKRLIAKYRLPASFWSSEYPPIPYDALFPRSDTMRDLAEQVRIRTQGADV